MRTITDFQKEVVKIYQSYTTTGTNTWDYKIAGEDLPYQVGSLTKYLMQLKGNRHSEGKNETEIKKNIGDELVDILAEVFFIADQLGINLEDAWDKMIESDKKKIEERTQG